MYSLFYLDLEVDSDDVFILQKPGISKIDMAYDYQIRSTINMAIQGIVRSISNLLTVVDG